MFSLVLRCTKMEHRGNPTEKELQEIFSVFPTCIAVTLMNPFLILQYETLPDRPWPINYRSRNAGLFNYLS